jgi:hypothetical protein
MAQLRFYSTALAVLGATSASLPVSAQQHDAAVAPVAPLSREQCVDAHRHSQELRRDNALLEARAEALQCARSECPGVIKRECGTYLEDLEAQIPSVTFSVTDAGATAKAARVFLDDAPVADWQSGAPVPVNPGPHRFRFELPPNAPVAKEVILSAGNRFRHVEASFNPPTNIVPPSVVVQQTSSDEVTRPVPLAVYPLVGAGVLGLAGFGMFAALGQAKENSLERSCAPECTAEEMAPMKRSLLTANISGGIGLAALGVASAVYFTRKTERGPRAAIQVIPTQGGAVASVTISPAPHQ